MAPFSALHGRVVKGYVRRRVLAGESTRSNRDGAMLQVARGLSFANGVALSEDEQWLFVAETGRYRVHVQSLHAKGLGWNPK